MSCDARVSRIVIVSRDGDATAARALGRRLGLPSSALSETRDSDLCLFVEDSGLSLGRGGARHKARARPEWRTRLHPRRSGAGAPRDPLLRALGRGERTILDATVGFGDDAFVLARHGHRVIAVERNPIVGLILEDALERARAEPSLADAARRISLRLGDSREIVEELASPVEAIYVDPMFPPRRKRSALPRLAMQLLHDLVGGDEDAEALFAAACAHASDRVVVKRPLRAEPLARKPDASHPGKLVRYDVYFSRRGNR